MGGFRRMAAGAFAAAAMLNCSGNAVTKPAAPKASVQAEGIRKKEPVGESYKCDLGKGLCRWPMRAGDSIDLGKISDKSSLVRGIRVTAVAGEGVVYDAISVGEYMTAGDLTRFWVIDEYDVKFGGETVVGRKPGFLVSAEKTSDPKMAVITVEMPQRTE